MSILPILARRPLSARWNVGSRYSWTVNGPYVKVLQNGFGKCLELRLAIRSRVKFPPRTRGALGGIGTIEHGINDTGGTANASNQVVYLLSYP
jgi:hypothetical protein